MVVVHCWDTPILEHAQGKQGPGMIDAPFQDGVIVSPFAIVQIEHDLAVVNHLHRYIPGFEGFQQQFFFHPNP